LSKKTNKELIKKEKFKDDNTLQIKLSNEQIDAISKLKNSTLSLIIGSYGTGKTLTAIYYALQELLKGRIEKIYISRPAVCQKEEEMGFLPGDISEKMSPYLMPIISNMYRCIPKAKIDIWLKDNVIEMLPLQYLKGVTYQEKSIAIIDEIQNSSLSSTKNIISRIGLDSQLILCGDIKQMDIKEKDSGMNLLYKFKDEDFTTIELTENHRHPIIERFTNYLNDTKI